MALQFEILKPSLGNPKILKPEELKNFELTLAGTSETPPTKKELQDFLSANPIKLIAKGKKHIPVVVKSIGTIQKLPKFTSVYTINHGSEIKQGVDNQEIQYNVGIRWDTKIFVGIKDADIAEFGTGPGFVATVSPFNVARYHAIYLHNDFKDFTILQITDLHISQRNDKIPEILCRVRNETECNDLKTRYINFNDNLRNFIKYVNYRVSKGEKIIVVATGDIVDYACDGWYDGKFILGQGAGGDNEQAPRRIDDVPEYNFGSSRSYSNIKKFMDIILDSDGKGETLQCPIYTILGNHDYYPNEVLINFKVHADYVVKEMKKNFERYADFGLKEEEAREYDRWAFPRNRGEHLSKAEQKKFKDTKGDGWTGQTH